MMTLDLFSIWSILISERGIPGATQEKYAIAMKQSYVSVIAGTGMGNNINNWSFHFRMKGALVS